MSRSFRLIVLASASFGLATGCYDFILPFYMEAKNISFGNMGIIFSLSGLAMVLGRVFVGRHSDRVGRKPYFLASLGLLSISTMSVPLLARAAALIISRTMTEISKELRATVHSVIVFDHVGERFLRFIGRASGPVYIMEGIGVIVAGLLLRWTGFTWTFVLMGAQLGAITLIFRKGFQEGAGLVKGERDTESLLSWHLPKELWLIALAGFLQVAGMSTSHCFVMPLFFKDRFGLSPENVALILAVHRITLGLPMLTSGITYGMSQRSVWVVFSTAQSVTMLATGLAPNVLWAVLFWWAHD
ncbi:MAG TPA: MFS transporter, partial [bacterium]|nr:MFS transporter [bacterium]